MFEEIKCLNPRKSNQSGCIKDKEGKIIFEAEQIIERWKEYKEDLFADQRPENPIKNFPKGPDITSQEVKTTLQQMKKGKAMGIDNIPTESTSAWGFWHKATHQNLQPNVYVSRNPRRPENFNFHCAPKETKSN